MTEPQKLYGESFFRVQVRKEVYSADGKLVLLTLALAVGLALTAPWALPYFALPIAIVLVVWANAHTTMSFYRQRVGKKKSNPYAVQYTINGRCPLGFHRATIIVTKKTI